MHAFRLNLTSRTPTTLRVIPAGREDHAPQEHQDACTSINQFISPTKVHSSLLCVQLPTSHCSVFNYRTQYLTSCHSCTCAWWLADRGSFLVLAPGSWQIYILCVPEPEVVLSSADFEVNKISTVCFHNFPWFAVLFALSFCQMVFQWYSGNERER